MSNMKNKKKGLPAPFAAPTKDARFEGTFEVFVPVPDRNRPHKVALQFDTLAAAESWIHSPDGEDAIAEILREAAEAK
jgi:antibiotic biosynthesis monooxygenase (ABM) superfamily enzyme